MPKIVPSLFGRWSVLWAGETRTFERLKDAERFRRDLLAGAAS